MIPPYELENKQFKKAVKGYNTTEVDEHLDFIIEKYTELYRAYNELERKYAETSAELEIFRNNEDAIRRALVEAQNTKSKIIKDATRRSEIILKSSKENCDRIIAQFKEQISRERVTLATLKAQVEEFKYRIFSQYQQHIEYLEQISPENDSGAEWNLPENEYAGKVVAQIVLDVENAEMRSKAESSDDGADVSSTVDTTLETLVSDREYFETSQGNDGEKAEISGGTVQDTAYEELSDTVLLPVLGDQTADDADSTDEDDGSSEEGDTLMFVINDLKRDNQ